MYVQIEKRTTVQKPQTREWTTVQTKDGWFYRRRMPLLKPPATRLVFRLVRSVRTERGPRPVLVCELGRIDVALLDRARLTGRLWDWIDRRLAEHAVSDAEAERIRARIAQHVPRPDPAAVAAAQAQHDRDMLYIEAMADIWGRRGQPSPGPP